MHERREEDVRELRRDEGKRTEQKGEHGVVYLTGGRRRTADGTGEFSRRKRSSPAAEKWGKRVRLERRGRALYRLNAEEKGTGKRPQ